MSTKNRTSSKIMGYGLYLYFFLGLSFRSTAKALSFLKIIKISHHVSIWKWLQKYKPKRHLKDKKIKEYSCIQKDEIAINQVLLN